MFNNHCVMLALLVVVYVFEEPDMLHILSRFEELKKQKQNTSCQKHPIKIS